MHKNIFRQRLKNLSLQQFAHKISEGYANQTKSPEKEREREKKERKKEERKEKIPQDRRKMKCTE